MTILEALKANKYDLRIDNSGKWLVWDYYEDAWRVYKRAKYQRNVIILIETTNEEEAVSELLKN